MLAAADHITIPQDMSPTAALLHLADSLTAAVEANLTLLMADDSADPVHKARVALRLQRLVGNRAGCSRRFAYGACLQQRIGCDRH